MSKQAAVDPELTLRRIKAAYKRLMPRQDIEYATIYDPYEFAHEVEKILKNPSRRVP